MKKLIIIAILIIAVVGFGQTFIDPTFGNTRITTTNIIGLQDSIYIDDGTDTMSFSFSGDSLTIGVSTLIYSGSLAGGSVTYTSATIETLTVSVFDTLNSYSDSTITNAIYDSLAAYPDTSDLDYTDSADVAGWGYVQEGSTIFGYIDSITTGAADSVIIMWTVGKPDTVIDVR